MQTDTNRNDTLCPALIRMFAHVYTSEDLTFFVMLHTGGTELHLKSVIMLVIKAIIGQGYLFYT